MRAALAAMRSCGRVDVCVLLLPPCGDVAVRLLRLLSSILICYIAPTPFRLLCTIVLPSVAPVRSLPLTHTHLFCTQRYPLLSLVDAQRSPRRIPPDDPEKVAGHIYDNDQ